MERLTLQGDNIKSKGEKDTRPQQESSVDLRL